MSTAAVLARIATQYSDKGSKAAQKDIARLTKKFEAFGKKAKKSFGLAITATAALSVKIGKDAVQAAIEDSKSQLILANAMVSSTNATKAAILQAEKYIEKTMYRVNVADEELRASLSMLITATGSFTEAEKLQTLALDVAAASGKDLATTTIAITKAQQGNVGALKKLSPELSGLIGKGTKASQVFLLLEQAYGGTAEELADLDPFKKLQLAYGEILETLGYELLPIVKEFVTYLMSDVIPIIKEWIETNGDQLRKALVGTIQAIIFLTDLFADLAEMADKYSWLIKLAFALTAVGGAMKAFGFAFTKGADALKVFGKIGPGIAKLVASLKTPVGEIKFFSTLVTGIGKVIKAVGLAIAAFLLLQTLLITAKNAVKRLFGGKYPWEDSAKKTFNIMDEITQKTSNLMTMDKAYNQVLADRNKVLQAARDKAEKAAEIAARNEAFDAARAAKEKAEERAEYSKMITVKKQLVAIGINTRTKGESKDLKAALELLKKKGKAASTYEKERIAAQIKIKANGIIARDNKDPIDLEAARLLLLKQKDNEESLKQLTNLTKNIFLQGLRNTLSERYQDILVALSDSKIDSKDIATLAGKWGVTIEAAKAYIETIFAISDGTISDDEITDLAKSWGSTKEQAAKYLDFFTYLNDGILSDAEIEKLKSKWGMTEAQVRQYADFVGVVNDGKLEDKEIKNLMAKWKMTSDEVVAYILKIGSPVSYSGTLISPAQIAELAWKSASAALAAYLALLAKGTGGTTVVPVVPKVADPGLGGSKTDSAASSNGNLIKALEAAAASKAAADAYAAAKAKGDMDAAAIAAAQVTPSAIAAQENGIIGAASIAAQLRAAEAAVEAASAAANQASTLAAFRDKEARDLATSQAAAAAMDYDERFRHRAAQGVLSASASSSSQAPVVVNLTVQGSVTTENDLVQTLRAGLLRGQYNGQSITLEAI